MSKLQILSAQINIAPDGITVLVEPSEVLMQQILLMLGYESIDCDLVTSGDNTYAHPYKLISSDRKVARLVDAMNVLLHGKTLHLHLDETANAVENSNQFSNPQPASPAKKFDPTYIPLIPKKIDDRHKSQLIDILDNLIPLKIKIDRPQKTSAGYLWKLDWKRDKAGLYLVGDNWSIGSLDYKEELAGEWEDFDLDAQLENNGVSWDE